MKRDKYSGKIINERYELIRLIDEGGMGAVYMGRDVKLGRKAAVKFLHSELTAGEASVKRFYREAQAASAVSHPNIISVFDVGLSEWGEPYLVMEYLSGETVGSLLKRKQRFSLPAALGILEQAIRGLSAAHDQSIIHRDLKPENIFVVRIPGGTPLIKLIDFGISKFVEWDGAQLTRTGALLGTPSYMSPEQARGKGEFDHRADLYSMGVILYLMLAGDHPFVGESYNDLIFNILTEPPRDPFSLNKAFPEAAAPIVSKLLEKSPEDRYSDCRVLLSAMEALPAYAEREAALRELAENMLTDSFATGDLGRDKEGALGEKPISDDLAATVLAKSDGGEPSASSGETGDNGKGADTEDATPGGNVQLENATPRKRSEPTSDGPRQNTPALETEGLSWDSIPSRVPPPRRRESKRRSIVATAAAAATVVAVGIGVVLGIDLLYSSDVAAPDTGASPPSQTEVAPPPSSVLPAVDTSLDEAADTDTESMDSESGGNSETDTTFDTANDSATSDALSDSDVAPQQPATSPTSGSTAPSLVGAPLPGQKGGGASPQPTGTVPPVGRVDVRDLGRLLPPPETQKPSSEEREPAPETAPKEKARGEDGLPPNPFEAAGQPILPRTIDRLVDGKSSRIRNCYDMARISAPEMEGVLELVVGVAGKRVQVSVKRNEMSAYLANCVVRVVKSIEPPPNDGTLVEILKEFEFRSLD